MRGLGTLSYFWKGCLKVKQLDYIEHFFFVTLPLIHIYNLAETCDLSIIANFRGDILRQINLKNYYYHHILAPGWRSSCTVLYQDNRFHGFPGPIPITSTIYSSRGCVYVYSTFMSPWDQVRLLPFPERLVWRKCENGETVPRGIYFVCWNF